MQFLRLSTGVLFCIEKLDKVFLFVCLFAYDSRTDLEK